MNIKKALIVSVKAGYGHHSTGQAIIDYFEDKGIECEMLDTFEYVDPELGDFIQDGYLLTTKYLPEAFGKVYSTLDKKESPYNKFSLTAILSKLVSHKIKDCIVGHNYDVIIGTHSYACMVMTYLREEGIITCPTFGIVTDFTVHPFWESTDLDMYVTPDSQLNRQMTKKGISMEHIMPTGIPIKKKFATKISKTDARNLLEIPDKKTILIMMGSMGFGRIIEEIEDIVSLGGDFQILCICGNNKKLYKNIEKYKSEWPKEVYNYGFVDNVDVMMDAADCIITKPGGLTSSESMAKGLPAILMNPIPGQEDRNMEFLVNNGAAMMVTDTFPVDEALYQLLNQEWRIKHLQESISHIGKPNSTRDLCEYIIKNY